MKRPKKSKVTTEEPASGSTEGTVISERRMSSPSSRSSSRSASPCSLLEAPDVSKEETLAERAERLKKVLKTAERKEKDADREERAAWGRLSRAIDGDCRASVAECEVRVKEAERAFDAAFHERARAEAEWDAAVDAHEEAERARRNAEEEDAKAAQRKLEDERFYERMAHERRYKRNYYVRLKYGATSNECPW